MTFLFSVANWNQNVKGIAATLLLKDTMKNLTAETIWSLPEAELTSYLEQSQHSECGKRIRFYVPSFMYYKTSRYKSSSNEFPTFSVTGNHCSLRCKHCNGKVLETMYPATTPEELLKVASRLKHEGSVGCLISGGCLPDGTIPLNRFIGAIGRIKKELGFKVFVHTGIINSIAAKKLKRSGIDAALIDVIGDEETIREVYNLNVNPTSYLESLGALDGSGIPFVPHVIVGLNHGRIKGEMQALQMISGFKPSAMVVIAFMPIHGTPMGSDDPPKPLDIARVLLTARATFPHLPVVLGCMRPKGKHRVQTDTLAIRAGVDAIAFPAEEAVALAESQGFQVSFSTACCAQVYADIQQSNVQ